MTNFHVAKKRMKSAALIALLLSLCLMSACGTRSHDTTIVAGSTSVQPYAEVLAEEYAHVCPESEIDIQGGGSSAGITAVESGTADIGMSSRVLNEKEQGLWFVEIAKDGLAIIVHPSNPVESLTLAQICGIYGATALSWGELGGRDAKIHVITREEGSGTRDAFISLVMGKERITPKAIVQDSNGAVRMLVADDPNAIGFISLGLVDDTVKEIKLDGVEPSFANIMNGSYTLFRPFLFVTAQEPSGEVKAFIDYALSPEGQRVLVHEGLIPAEEGAGR